jgi:hypothetical protein
MMKLFDHSGIIAVAVTAVSITGYDIWAKLSGHQTWSGGFWELLDNPYLAPVLIGFWFGAGYHLYLDNPRRKGK